jgi:hypothetical protein
MTNTKAFNVGTILDNGDTVFHITDTEYWVVAPQSLWKECDWSEGVAYCQSVGYEMPSRDILQTLYDCRDNVYTLPTAFVWSSTEHGSDNAWYLYFGYRNWSYDFKSLSCWVLPVRKVPIDSVLEGGHYTDSRALTDTVDYTVDRVQYSTVARVYVGFKARM